MLKDSKPPSDARGPTRIALSQVCWVRCSLQGLDLGRKVGMWEQWLSVIYPSGRVCLDAGGTVLSYCYGGWELAWFRATLTLASPGVPLRPDPTAAALASPRLTAFSDSNAASIMSCSCRLLRIHALVKWESLKPEPISKLLGGPSKEAAHTGETRDTW